MSPPVLPTGEPKTSAQRFLSKARCPVEEGDGEPPLKFRRTGDILQSTVPSEEHSLVIRRLLEPKAEQPESAKYCRTGVGTGSGGTEIASMVDPLKDFKEVQKELAAEKDRAQRTKEGLAATQAELAGTRAELAGTQTELAAQKDRAPGLQAELAGTWAELAGTQAELAAEKDRARGLQAELAGTWAELAGTQAELAAEKDRAREIQAELAGTRAQLADTQAQLAGLQSQVAETKAQVAATEARADQLLAKVAYQQEEIERTHAQAQGIRAQAQGIKAEVAAYQVQLAATLQVAQKAQADAALLRPFAEDAAMCQVQALLECYQILYFKEANNFRKGQPQNFMEAKHLWNDFVSRASPEEELHMVSKGFTRAATDAAKKGLDSFQDQLTAAIHKLDRGLITHFFSLLNLTGDPGLEQALAVVDAHNASLSI